MTISKIKNITPIKKFDRSKPPKSGKPKDVNFPKFFEKKLDNGITVLVIEDSRLPLITSRFVFKGGSYFDTYFGENKSGLGSLTSELLIKGTKNRTATEIAKEVDYIGASLASGSDYNATYISSYSLKKYFDTMFDIVSDVILNPTFADDEISRLKEQRLNTLLTLKDEGDYLSDVVFKKFVYKKSPYAYPVEGTNKSIKELTSQNIKFFYEKLFVPSNLIVSFVGDITPEMAMFKLNEKFSSWQMENLPFPEVEISGNPNSSQVYLTEKKGAVQSSMKIGHLGIKRSNHDFIPVFVMNTLLGGYFTSRINRNLREINGYTYGARSFFNCNKYSGDFSIVTEVKNDITANTINEILKELNSIKNEFISNDELQNVKNYISGNFPLQLETPNAIASKVINLKLHDLPDDYYNTYIQNVNNLSVEDIRNAAVKYLHPDKLTISIAGNVNEIKEGLKQFGDVNVVEEIF